MKLNNKFAIGCLVQWYEIEIFEEYFESLKNALKDIDNKENVVVDIFFNMAQNLEQVDEDEISIQDIFDRFMPKLENLLLLFSYTARTLHYCIGYYKSLRNITL